MPRPKSSGTGRLRKLECPVDGMIAYASRGAVIRHGLPYCACGERMYFADLEDQFTAAPDQAPDHPDFDAFVKRENNRAVREATHVPAERLRCGGCGSFVPAANTRHICGFHNDIRGNRNHGTWAGYANRAGVHTPF